MPETWDVNWKGPEVQRTWFEAARKGIDDTMAKCIEDAQPNTPYDTGNLRRSEKIQQLAHRERETVVGLWGVTAEDADYAIFIEVGARGRPGVNMLRNAADKEYPKLQSRIKGYLS